MSIVILVLLVLLLVGALPNWGYVSGYSPAGLLGLVLVVYLILLILGKV